MRFVPKGVTTLLLPYIVSVAAVLLWVSSQSVDLATATVDRSAHLIAQEVARTVGDAAANELANRDLETRRLLDDLVVRLTARSDVVRNIAIVDTDGTLVASENPSEVGRAVLRPEAMFDAVYPQSFTLSALNRQRRGQYNLFVPLVHDSSLVGYTRLTLQSDDIARLHDRTAAQFRRTALTGLFAVSVVGLILQIQLTRRNRQLEDRMLQLHHGGRSVTAPPTLGGDAPTALVQDQVNRAATATVVSAPSASSALQAAGQSDADFAHLIDLQFAIRLQRAFAHELKDSLSAMRINLGLIQAEFEDRIVEPGAQGASDQAAHCLNVLRQEVARIEHRSQTMLAPAPSGSDGAPVEVNLRELLSEIVEQLRPLAAEHRVLLHADIAPEPVWTRVRRDQLRQALLRVGLGSLDATPAGGRLAVSMVTRHGRARIDFSESGVGEALADANLDLSVGDGILPGTLNLKVAMRIVDAAGGEIRVEALGGLTCVTVYLPAIEPKAVST